MADVRWFKPIMATILYTSTALTPFAAMAQVAAPPAPTGTIQETPAPTSTETAPATAQSSDADDSSVREIVVTGTLLRGVAPAGASTIGLNREAIAATGATSSAQLLSNIPQIASTFNALPTTSGAVAAQSVNRINLRAIPGSTGGGSATLLLLDGHRLPGMGVQQTIPDPDAIPPAAIERLEIVPDGGSSTYGADAVAGVVNFITRRRFDGVQASGRYGFADNYKSTDANLIVGKAWDNVSAYVAYNFARHDALFGRDRDFARRYDYQLNVPLDTTCSPGNIVIGSSIYALPGLTLGTGNRCDGTESGSILPRETRHSVLGSFSADIGSKARFDLRAFYTNRQVTGFTPAPPVSVSVSRTNPFYRSVGGTNATATQTVSFDISPVVGSAIRGHSKLDAWQVAPSFSYDLGPNWQLRALGSYGRGINQISAPSINTGALSALVQAGTFNPYDPGASGNLASYPSLLDYGEYGRGVNGLSNARVLADGRLFTLPGGDVRIAVGGEWQRETYKIRYGTGTLSNVSTLPSGGANRHIEAAFGELQVPIVGEGNRGAGFYSLTASASGRYDHYSDFGGTFNPKFGLTYAPLSWARLRGTWGKSFQAPSLADTASAAGSSIIAIPFVVFASPAVAARPGQAQIFLSGGGVNLQPQKAKTWSAGFEVEPPFLPGLSIKGTYYSIDFHNQIAIPPIFNPTVYYALFTEGYVLNPTAAQVAAFGAQAPGGSSVVAPYTLRDGQVYSISDGRRQNLASSSTNGLDFGVSYDRQTGFGSIYASVNGNYILHIKQQAKAGAPTIDTIDNDAQLRVGTTLGTTIGGLRAQATLNHQGGLSVTPTAASLNQSHIKSYNIVKLFFQYDVKGSGLLNDLSFTLNIDNLLDTDPPAYNGSLNGGYGYAGGNPLGRFVQFGITKKF